MHIGHHCIAFTSTAYHSHNTYLYSSRIRTSFSISLSRSSRVHFCNRRRMLLYITTTTSYATCNMPICYSLCLVATPESFKLTSEFQRQETVRPAPTPEGGSGVVTSKLSPLLSRYPPYLCNEPCCIFTTSHVEAISRAVRNEAASPVQSTARAERCRDMN